VSVDSEEKIMPNAYEKTARQEAAAAAEASILARAADMERIDAEKARLAKLAVEHGLPEDAPPRSISDAMIKRWEEHRHAVRGKYGPWTDPDQFPVGSITNP
jgi:hypothetical protein